MKTVKLVTGKTYTLGETQFVFGEERTVEDDIAKVLLSKVNDYSVRYFREVIPATGSEDAALIEVQEEVAPEEVPVDKKPRGKVQVVRKAEPVEPLEEEEGITI